MNLAMIYYSRGKFADAETLNISVLEKWKGVVGEDSPGIMNILNNLAMVYRRIGRFDSLYSLSKKLWKDENACSARIIPILWLACII